MPTQPPTLPPKLERFNQTTFCDHGLPHGVCFGASSKATVKYHHQNNLPTIQMWNSHPQREPQAEAMEAYVLNVNNMNLKPPQKELLHWHFHLCHQGFDSLQRLLRTGHLGNSPLTRTAAKCDIPTCSACEFAKAKHRPTATQQQLPVSSKTHALKRDQLYPGQRVSMDHFTVTEHGHLYTSMGKTASDLMYTGGCIFCQSCNRGCSC